MNLQIYLIADACLCCPMSAVACKPNTVRESRANAIDKLWTTQLRHFGPNLLLWTLTTLLQLFELIQYRQLLGNRQKRALLVESPALAVFVNRLQGWISTIIRIAFSLSFFDALLIFRAFCFFLGGSSTGSSPLCPGSAPCDEFERFRDCAMHSLRTPARGVGDAFAKANQA